MKHVLFLLAAPLFVIAQLPEGPNGLARQFPGDVGIEKHGSVIFVERFDESSIEELTERWESKKEVAGMAFVKDPAPGSSDATSLLITHVGGKGTGSQLYRRLKPGHKKVFARSYVKFDPGCYNIHHFGTHLGGFNPSTPWPQGGAGERPSGHKRFTTGVEPYGKNWHWDFYSYWQGMHRHGGGKYWGTPFLTAGSTPPVEKGKWICVEMMVKMNDPGKSNGEQAFWIDGQLFRRDGQIVSHIGPGFPKGKWTGGWWQPNVEAKSSFEGFNWSSTEKLAVNYLWTYLYITKAPKGHVSKVGFDNIVVATEYIGPITPR